MGIKVGIDFGTATTSVAVLDEVRFVPSIVPIAPYGAVSDSLVWLDRGNGRRPLVLSESKHNRHPLSVCAGARTDFNTHWAERVHAYGDFRRRSVWNDAQRDSAMLLSYFKPELADPEIVDEVFEPLDRLVYTTNLDTGDDLVIGGYTSIVRRQVARPAPATPDYVAGMAALLRLASKAAVDERGDRISSLALGLPSFQASASEEAVRARTNRLDAVKLADIEREFGARDFEVVFCGEALAAAWGIEVEYEGSEARIIVVDVGAGTTDLSYLTISRSGSGRWQPRQELVHRSLRWAGRDINAVIAYAVAAMPEMRRVEAAMDPRAWQRLLDMEMEDIKRTVTNEPRLYTIPLHQLAAHPDGISDSRQHFEALHRTVQLSIGLDDIDWHLDRWCAKWRGEVKQFCEDAERESTRQPDQPLAGIEIVGGAAKFVWLRAVIERTIEEAGLGHIAVRYRDSAGEEAQTVVARGLARRAALRDSV